MTQLELPTPGSPFDTIRRTDESGEWWSARELMPLLGYSKWDRFADAIDRAIVAATNSGTDAVREFSQVAKLTGAGNLGEQARKDYRLSRYAAYLIAMNGDPRKGQIAAAQSYFAIRTREAEAREELDELEAARRYVKAIEEKRAAMARADVAEQRALELAPAAAQAEHYRAAEGLTAIGDFANDLALWARETHNVKVLHREVRDFMGELGLLIRGNTIRNNEPTADAQKRGLLRIKHSTFETKTRGTQSSDAARLTQKGCGLVWDRAVVRIAEHGSLLPPASMERKAS